MVWQTSGPHSTASPQGAASLGAWRHAVGCGDAATIYRLREHPVPDSPVRHVTDPSGSVPDVSTRSAVDAQSTATTRPAWTLRGQTLTALVSSATFFVLVMIVAVAPVPFVAWSPGRALDVAGRDNAGEPVIRVEGLPSAPINGHLRMTTVSVTSVDSHLGLLQAILNHAAPNRDVLPRRMVYPPNKSTQEVKAEEIRMMDDSQANAVIAALRAAGQVVEELPRVDAVSLSGPALNKLQPGDLITAVDGTPVKSTQDVGTRVRAHRIGTPVVFSVLRAGAEMGITVNAAAAPNNPDQAAVGIEVGLGYRYTPKVTYGLDPSIVGPSAGVIFSLAIYDLVTPDEDLLAGRDVAGTGTIRPDGTVGPIGGIQEKIQGAQRAGSKIFLVPAANCKDLAGVRTDMELVKVATLRDAITGLQKLKASQDGTGVPRC